MKVGIFLTCQHPPGSDMISAPEGQYAMARLARERGWDAVATGQHYLSEGGAGRSSWCRISRGSPRRPAR